MRRNNNKRYVNTNTRQDNTIYSNWLCCHDVDIQMFARLPGSRAAGGRWLELCIYVGGRLGMVGLSDVVLTDVMSCVVRWIIQPYG